MPSRRSATGLILAGGRSHRLGTDKAALVFNGQTLLDKTLKVMASVADELLVVGRPGLPSDSSVLYIPDDTPDLGPLGGIASGLRVASHELCIVVACDLPFLQAEVIAYLLSCTTDVARPSMAASPTAAPEYQAVIPRINNRIQLLHAIYRRDALSIIEQQIASRDLKLEHLVDRLTVRWVDEAELRPLDPDLRSFLNVNTPEDWQAARNLP